jgi:hypothetical protein
VAHVRDEFGVFLELVPVAALADERLVEKLLGDDHMRQRGHNGHVGAGAQGQVMCRLDMRRFHQVDAARVDHDQLRPCPQAFLQAARRRPGARRSGSPR